MYDVHHLRANVYYVRMDCGILYLNMLQCQFYIDSMFRINTCFELLLDNSYYMYIAWCTICWFISTCILLLGNAHYI